jgi:hypothetical protein
MCTPKKLFILFIFMIFVFPTTTVFAAQSHGHPDAIGIQSAIARGSSEMDGNSNLEQRIGMQNLSFDYPIGVPVQNTTVEGCGITALSNARLLGTPSGESSVQSAHWWLTHYWYFPTQMFGDFIAVDNTISGLSWGDAVLILPLNVAYGTGSSNFIWFQFDVRFRNLWPASSVQVSIWYNVQSGTGPMQYNQVVIYDDLHNTFLGNGLDYIASHSYAFSLTTSGGNTATFALIDRTAGRSWWRDFNVPSTSLLYNPTTPEGTAFSPASCVEGYTSQAALSNVPFFQFRVANSITSYSYTPDANAPSGITTDQNNINDDLRYWEMLTPGQLPKPSISSVTYPAAIGVGEAASIDVISANNGGAAEWQTIAISFPLGESISSLSITDTDLSSAAVHQPGTTVSALYSTTTMTLASPVAEGSSKWLGGTTHHLKISVKPGGTGSFKFYVKSIAAAVNWACNWDPKTGDKDQQMEFVKTYTISVGVNPSSISVGVNPSQIILGSGTTISGTVSSPVPGDFSGTVYLQYSTDGSNWNLIGSTQSSSSGYYSYWWTPSAIGTFYVRSYWNGNTHYGGATSTPVTLTVTSPGGNLADHTMCKGVQPNDPWDPITRTNTFYTDDPAAYSWLKFVDIYDGPHYVHWDWYDPDGQHWTWDTTIPAPPPGQYWIWYKVSSYLGPLHFADSKLGRTFTTKVYYDSNLVVTETWTVIKHQSSISVSLSSNSITYGQSVMIGSQLSPSFSDGTTTLQYSTDGVNWNNLASGTPSNGYYSYTWTPPNTGTYYFRAIWSGNLDYYGSTSSTQTLSVNRASTSLTTSVSSSTITYGSSVTITASMSPALQGKSVTIQYSIDGSTWFYLSSGTTNSAGQYSYSWTPDAGVYYLRSTWSGDTNYYGATSPSQQLTVNKASTSTSCSLSTHSINYGESVIITGTVSVPVNDGTMTLENSTDEANWNLISSGVPSSGSYQYTWTPTGGGTFYIRAVWSGNHNYLGSTSSSQTLNVLVDNTPPVVIISCPANGDYIGPVPMIWVNGTVTEDNKGTHVPLINDTRFTLAQWESATGKFAFKNGTTIPDASIPVRINFTDIAGNTGSSTVRFTVDTTKPAVDIKHPADGVYLNAGTVWVNGTITELNKGGSAPATNDSSFTLSAWNGVDFAFRNQTAIADGTISVSVSFTDLAGNTGSRTVTFTLDTVYPVINITYPLEGHYFDGEAVIWINGTFAERNLNLTKPLIVNDTSFMLANWAWNLTTYEGTFAFKNATALLDGTYHVKVGITDLAGNSGSATVTFTVDTMPPIVVITHPINGQYLDPLAIWVNGTVTDLNKGTLQPQINGTEFSLIAWDPITGAFAFKNNTAIPDGSIFIRVSFTDLAGKTGNATVYFMLDTTAPVVTITYPTEGTYLDGIKVIWINGTFIEKNFDIAGLAINGTFAYVTHTWNPITCEGTFAFKNTSALADGTYQMMVSLTDKSGKTGFETVTFSVDTVPPIVDIAYPTNGQYLNTTTVWVNGTIAELNKGTNQPQINNPAFSLLSWDAATGAFAFRSDAAIPEGTISVAVNFTDLAGKTGTATVYFILDTTLPIVNITYPTGGAYLNAPILWINGTITELNKGTLQPSINDSRLSLTFWNSTSGVFAFENSTAISDGLISLRVSFADLAGKTGFGTVFFTLDTTAPIIAITTPLNSLYVKGSVWINATIVEINPFSYIIAINGTPVSSGSGQISWQWLTTIYADGAYVVNVTATDAAGNNGSDAVTVTADNTPPVETIVSPLLGSCLNYSTVWINETLADATSGINLTTIITSLNGVPVSYDYDIATGLLSYHAVGLADGNYTVAVTVEDLAGNMATNSWWFVVDVTPPVMNVVSPTPGSYLNVSTVWINETLTDVTSGINASTIAMTLNTILVPCNFDPATGLLSYQAVFLADGLYTVNVSVRDIAGNLAANSWNFTIDITEPVVTILYPTEGANVTITPTLWINGTVTELNMGVLTPSINDSRFNLAHWDYVMGKFAFSNNTVISEGPICVMVNFTDLAGNTGLETVTFNLTAPMIKLDTKIVFTLSPNPAYVGQVVTLLGNLTESDTGMPISNAQVDLYVNGTFKGNLWTNASGWFQGSGYVSSGICQISVTYSGNATFNPSSRTETLTVYVATIKVWTDKTVYHVGETMKVYVRVRNGGSALPVRAIITVKLPNGDLYTVLNMTTTLPANYDSGDVLWNTFIIPTASLGNYTWIAELRNPTTGALISQSTWNWSLAATAMETPSVEAVLQENPNGIRLSSLFCSRAFLFGCKRFSLLGF